MIYWLSQVFDVLYILLWGNSENEYLETHMGSHNDLVNLCKDV